MVNSQANQEVFLAENPRRWSGDVDAGSCRVNIRPCHLLAWLWSMRLDVTKV
ncbi:MAG: hypothetical protein HY318_14830 [Armatimonadetes bacterium]|nr:hypothetical protein [Armatimonadota bacterium]